MSGVLSAGNMHMLLCIYLSISYICGMKVRTKWFVLLLWNGGRRAFGVSGALTAVAKHWIILSRCSSNQVKYCGYSTLFPFI